VAVDSASPAGDTANVVQTTAKSTRTELVAILNHIPAMVAYWSNDLRNVFANEAYSERFGLSTTPSEMVGMRCRDLFGPELFARNLPYLRGVLAGRPQTFERAITDAAGRTRSVSIGYTPHLVDGVVQGFFVLGTDVTARVEAEAALHQRVTDIATAAERQRIETALHDTVLQRLFAAGLELEAATPPDAVDTAARIRTAISGIDSAIIELRSTVHVDADPSGFTAAMDQVVQRVTATLGFAAKRTFTGALETIPSTVWAEMLTVLNAALADVARYAHASHVDIRIAARTDKVELRVRDDGPAPDQRERSAGLSTILASAERLGGNVSWLPNKPNGTIINWRVPYAGEPAASMVDD
jgi:PAS domain S-box-containing protein